MSGQQRAKVDAIARYLHAGEERFLRRLADYANHAGDGAFPRRKTLIAETGLSRRWLEVLERKLVARGWIEARAVGSGHVRRTFYRLTLPEPSAFQSHRQSPRSRKQLLLPFPVENPVEKLTEPVDADRIEYDPQIVLMRRRSHSTPSVDRGLADEAISDPKNLDPKDQKKEKADAARRLPLALLPLDPGKLKVAKAGLRDSLIAERERRRLARGGRR